MITDEDIRILGKKLGKPAGTIDKDYAIEWLLYGIYHKESTIRNSLIFKGGTSIRKIFFPNMWRFSEDLDFTIAPNVNPYDIISGFEKVCDILDLEVGMKYEGNLNVLNSSQAILGDVRFTGPIGMKNRINIDISRVEKMIDSATTHNISSSYVDLKNFSVKAYTFNEILVEKIRSLMQRTNVRDYYDVWKILESNIRQIDTVLIAYMVKQKCIINNIEYDPSKIFDVSRLIGLKMHWKRNLERLVVEDLPEPDKVFEDMKSLLKFLLD